MTARICNYCQQEVPTAHLEELRMHGIDVHFCVGCQAEYMYWSDGALAATHLYTNINHKMYRWSIYPTEGVRIWHFNIPGVPGISPNKESKMLIHFENLQSTATPQNVSEKLRNILLFL